MIQEWWSDLVRWFRSDEGWTITTTVVLPAVAILVSGVVAALIARGASIRLLKRQDRQQKAAAIAALLAVVRRATVWSSLSTAEKDHLDYQVTESIVRLRLLPIAGSDLAAEWAQYRIAAIKRHSAALIAEAESELKALEDGLVEWHRSPSRGKKQFTSEIAYLRFDAQAVDSALIAEQIQWQAAQDGRAASGHATRSSDEVVIAEPVEPDSKSATGDLRDMLAGTPTASR